MLKILRNPSKDELKPYMLRAAADVSALESSVREILDTVRSGGDEAVRNYTARFDKVDTASFVVPQENVATAGNSLDDALKAAIRTAARNIETFHRSQQVQEPVVETRPGVRCWRKSVPIQRVGLYIPGGSAPLFSTLLMLGIPARIAGCPEIVLCTPPGPDGSVHPAILFAAQVVGIDKIYCIGGVQAIAALAFGTESIPKVDKIFGPGNAYVTAAKQLVSAAGVAIDLPAGPSELAVLADETANPRFIASDLLSQAEHGPDSQVVLVSNSEQLIAAVNTELSRQLEALPRREIAAKALENSVAILVGSPEAGLELLNEYAPEHLIISCADAKTLAGQVCNAGSVFLGNYSPESAGDYASGTNHTLPTQGHARAYSGVSLDSFVKKITFQQLSHQGLKELGPHIEVMAAAEGLQAHKNAVTIRLHEIASLQL